MKVLALVTDGLGGYGGIAQYNRDFIGAISSLDVVESIRLLPRGNDHADRHLPSPRSCVREERAVANRVLYSLRALMIALRFRPDVIFCGHLFMAPLAWFLSDLLRVPWWLQLHGIEAWERPGFDAGPAPFPKWLPIHHMIESAAIVTAVSRYTRRRFLTWANVAPDRVHVLPNTYQPPLPANATKNELKAKFGLTDRKVILTVSRIDRGDHYKGHDRVISALSRLLRNDKRFVYVIVGDGDNRGELEEHARQRSVQEYVRFVGRVSADVLHDYYAMADVFAMPSTNEGFGIVFLEALAHRVPVISGDCDGSVDALADGVLGTAVKVSDEEALASAIVSASSGTAAASPSRFARDAFTNHLGKLVAELAGSS